MQRVRRNNYYLAVATALAAFIVYLPTLRNEFVNWDDDIYVYDNPQIRSLDVAFCRWAFLGFHVSNWHPLTWLSHAFDYALWGLNPLGHHLTNIILHAVNAALVALLAVKLLEIARERSARNASSSFLNDRTILIAAGVTSLLFGIHPAHVESVAWVSERKDLLCALFFLLGTMAYVNAVIRVGPGAESIGKREEGKRLCAMRYALCFFVLALLSKPMAVTLPVVLLILDWYPLGRVRSWKTLWSAGVEKLPFFVLCLVSSLMTMLAQKAEGAMAAMNVVPWPVRTLVAAKALIAYLEKMLLPMNLLPFYPYPSNASLFSFHYLLAIGLLIGITITCVVFAKRQPVWLASWGYYVATLIPVLGIIQVGGQEMADRYTYLPSLGPFLIIGIMAASVSEKAARVKQSGLVIVSFAAVIIVLIALSSLTIRQIAVWRTSMDLWNNAIKKGPEVPLAYYNRGQVSMSLGLFDVAIEDYSKAIALNPFYQEAFYNRGLAFEKIGQPDRAIKDYEKAISLNPSNYQAINNRGVLYGAAGSFEQAIELFTRALAVNPRYLDAYFNRGITYAQAGRQDQALMDFDKAIELNQQFAPAYLNRGKLLLGMGLKSPAAKDFEMACELGISQACGAIP